MFLTHLNLIHQIVLLARELDHKWMVVIQDGNTWLVVPPLPTPSVLSSTSLLGLASRDQKHYNIRVHIITSLCSCKQRTSTFEERLLGQSLITLTFLFFVLFWMPCTVDTSKTSKRHSTGKETISVTHRDGERGAVRFGAKDREGGD